MQARINFTEYGQQQLALMEPIRKAESCLLFMAHF